MGTLRDLELNLGAIAAVSIQLISPASGDTNMPNLLTNIFRVSIQLISPASGDIPQA